MVELKVGDRVKIADDSPLARLVLKESNAGDGPYKWSLFGKIGTISQSWTVNGNYAVTMNDENEYCWPPVLLEKLPAEECKNIHRVRGVAAGEAFGEAMEYAAHRIVYDYMTSMEAIAKGESPSSGAEIVFDHVVNFGGKCMLQIAEIRGILSPDELPDEYLNGDTRMDLVLNGLWMTDGELAWRYYVGQLLTEEEAAKLVKRMRACGKRLHDINAAARAKADEERLERWKAKGRKAVRI